MPRTWTQTLLFHPHVHMAIPAGGLTERGGWRRSGRKFFAPVKATGTVFRAKLVAGVRRLRKAGDLELGDMGPEDLEALLDSTFGKPWVACCKKPFGGSAGVVRYLGRHAHRVAIANSRIRSVDGGRVTFAWRDSREGRRTEKEMTVTAEELVRRLLPRVLPKGFAKVRYFGIYASRGKSGRLELCRRLTGAKNSPLPLDDGEAVTLAALERLLGRAPGTCARCGGRLYPARTIKKDEELVE